VKEITFYSRHGDWFVWVAALVAVAGFADVLRARRRVDKAY